MKKLNAAYDSGLISQLPERVIQFGEGNFLRGFMDWMIHKMNQKNLFHGRIVAVQPTPHGRVVGKLNAQDGLYTTILQGIQNGAVVDDREIISSVSRGINPYEDWAACLACAEDPAIEFVFSNTTEAGLSYNPEDCAELQPPLSYPGKLTAYLYHRYRHFSGSADKGMTILPCELVEKNGDLLKKLVLQYAADWKLEPAFGAWVENSNVFINSLVDRVVSGYPKEKAEVYAKELGYEDALLVCGEVFHFLALEGEASLEEKLPFKQAGLNVVIEKDIEPYRKRKVRILNGAHTASVPAAFLADLDTVGEMMQDPDSGSFVRKAVYEAILPSIDLAPAMLKEFADAVMERFENPFIRHMLQSILLNSTAKFPVRVLPSLLEYKKACGCWPKALVFSLAAYLYLYKDNQGSGNTVIGRRGKGSYEITDAPEQVALLRRAWALFDDTEKGAVLTARAALQERALWGDHDLSAESELAEETAAFLLAIAQKGARAVMQELGSEKKKPALKIHSRDNVAVALCDLAAGEPVVFAAGQEVLVLQEGIRRGHKFALKDFIPGEKVIKYGFPIGQTKAVVKKGCALHTHNIATRLDEQWDYVYEPEPPHRTEKKEKTFQGYRRKNGKTGIRNEIWIIPTVSCVNRTAEILKEYGKAQAERYHLDGCQAFTHPYGCSQMGDDQKMTQRILADLVAHPNAGAVLVVGLGCENNHVEAFKAFLGDYDADRVKFLVAQDVEDEVEAGKAMIDELAAIAAKDVRTTCALEDLVIGLKCGGSDGLSGITANPLIGEIADVITGSGGSAVLTEIPEMFGAEEILMNRAASQEVFEKMVRVINSFKNYFTEHHQTVYENPSPGNKEGGISTLEDKSLGCVQKGGRAQVVDVLDYGERIEKRGLQVLKGPGNDAVSTTVLAAGGCQLILFSTGRGTPWGTAVPVVKLSTNTALFKKKQNWMDFNAGELVAGKDMEELRDEFLEYILRVASGEKVKAEKMGFAEIAIWKDGVTM